MEYLKVRNTKKFERAISNNYILEMDRVIVEKIYIDNIPVIYYKNVTLMIYR